MTLVKIPFKEQFREPMLSGKKVWTSRTKKYGKEGDIFHAFNTAFRILDVFHLPLHIVATNYEAEGCNSYDNFVRVWEKIHPRRGFDEDQMVYVHTFCKLNDLPEGQITLEEESDKKVTQKCPDCKKALR